MTRPRHSAILVTLALLGTLAAATGAHGAPITQTLTGNLPPLLARATLVGAGDVGAPIHLVVGVRADRAPASDVPVAAWLVARGFTVTYDDGIIVDADGTLGAAQDAFGVRLGLYRMPDGAIRRAPDREPSAPLALAASIESVQGLDNVTQLAPLHGPARLVTEPDATIGSTDGYAPNDTAIAYDVAPLYARGINGTGWAVGIATAYDIKTADETAFDQKWSLPPHRIYRTCVDGKCAFDANAGSDETTLDVEWATATARGSIVRLYEGHDASLATFTDVYARAVNGTAKAVSTSWGLCETDMPSAARATDERLFARAASNGQTWFVASGDSGSSDCSGRTGVDYPASSPHVIGVGGTRLECAGWPACAAPGNETAWDGSGGGASSVFAKPSWQAGAGVPADGKRDVPDVALTADPARGNFVRFNGAWYVFGGTSEAAPQWAGLWALSVQHHGSGFTNASATLYSLAGSRALHDVTSGCNGAFCAAAGYDRVTGLGTFDAQALVDAT